MSVALRLPLLYIQPARTLPAIATFCDAVTFVFVYRRVDEMGLGKTLQSLMLVLSNPTPAGWPVSSLEGLKKEAEGEPVPIKTSLVVVPANLMTQ